MVDDEILTRTYEVTPESLWPAVKQALSTGIGATLKEADEEQRRAIFTTEMSWTSWGENMVAAVEPGQPTGSLLKITGHAHTSILTTKWGEELHQHQFTKNLVQAVEQALREAHPVNSIVERQLDPTLAYRKEFITEKVVPMIHVPDVRATVEWYQSIGFTVSDTYDDGGDGLSFAILSFGSSKVMFNSGGQPSNQHRREVDLYVYVDNVDDLYRSLKDRVEIVEGLHDTFYGMREFIIRDVNRFWLTFAQFASTR